MPIIERYFFRISATAFVACLGALTAMIWLSQALREMNLVTGKGQTVLVFLQITLFGLPALVTIIAPVALFIALLYALNRLNSDSELIVISASGLSPKASLRPFAVLALLCALMVGYMTLHAIPQSFQSLRVLITKVRTDLVTRLLQEGKFIALDRGILFHFRERLQGGGMGGVMIHDSRDPKLSSTYLAERGAIIESEGNSYLVLERGSMQRQDSARRENTIIAFESYVFDLEQFEQQGSNTAPLKPRERATLDLWREGKPTSPAQRVAYNRLRVEFHDRFVNVLYPFATLAIAFAALGIPRTTRQNRGLAITSAVLALVALRIAGFAAASLAARTPSGLYWMYGVPFVAIGLSTLITLHALRPHKSLFSLPQFTLPWGKTA